MEIVKVGFLLFMIIFQAHESTGYSISQLPEISSIHHLREESAPNIGKYENTKKIGILSPLPLPRGSAIPPAAVSQPHTSVPMSQPFEGFLPAMAPSPPVVVPSLNSAQLPQVIQGVAPSMPPNSPIVKPTAEPAPAPETLQRLVPSVPPIPPDGSTDYTPPVKQFVQGIEPSTPPSGPVVVPPDKSEPIPQPLKGIVPILPPIPPVDVPSRNSAPSPIFVQGNVPSTPPSPQVVVPSNKSELVPQPLQELAPSTPPRPPVFVPSEKSAPMFQVVPGIVPSIPPDPPTILPSNKSSPLPQVVPGIVPSLPPNSPVTVASNKSAPMPLVVPEVPSVSPVPPISVPSNKSAPPPEVVTGIVLSMPPNPPVTVSSNTSAPLPRVAPINVRSMSPVPPISVPSNTSAPPLQVVTGIVPSITPNPPDTIPSNTSAPLPQVTSIIVRSIPPIPPISVPSNKSAQPPQAIPGNVPSMPPNPPITVPSSKSAPPPRVAPTIVPSVPLTPTITVSSDKSLPLPQVVPRVVPSMPPSSPIAIPSNRSAQRPQVVQGIVPSISPSLPIVVPSHKVAPKWQVPKGIVPSMPPSVPSHGIPPESGVPTKMPLAPALVESPPNIFPRKPPAMHPIMPRIAPSVASPVESPPGEYTRNPPAAHPTLPKIAPSMESEPATSPLSTPPSGIKNKTHGIPVASPPLPNHFPPVKHPSIKASPPRKSRRPSNNAPAPSKLSPRPVKSSQVLSPASPPAHSYRKYHHSRRSARTPAPAPPFLFPPQTSNLQGPATDPPTSPSPIAPPKQRTQRHRHYPPPTNHGPSLPPRSSTSGSLSRKPRAPLPPLIQALPPPPPNQDCMALACTEPLTNSPPGSPCGCVAPMQVGLRLGVALYAFFPLVSELAEEIATGVFMKLSQVRVKGANADGQQLDETVVLIDLVPLGERFDNTTAFLTFEKFWRKQVPIKATLFGDYEVLYVRYPGLPPSPPSAPITTLDDGSVHGSHGRAIHPFGVDVRKKRGRIGGTLIAIIILSSSIAIALGFIVVWLLILRCGNHTRQIPATAPPLLTPSLSKPSAGTAGSMVFGSGPSSASMSFASSINTYAGSAKTYSAGEIEKATNNFHDTRILGEGGFGRVYRGILDDGTNIAVKVLKRDDQQGGREFLAEVEMLGRLHHRNLVKLIGICVEEKARCLVYELISNGSVESHLHGPDRETAPLDWGSRIKIALGAARGLAYLHEDSSPHVIHRDFKSSNILLEHDFTPKVSDFGLARTALEEGDQHITTRVMGTFGYVAPEYAMTGHLLVKSDVYSYGVVLLELLTGRKPVDMSQRQGQENLVSWARPFLTSKEGLEMIIDPSLGSNVPFDSVGKVAAIASLCVQPEVTHRPFMGEVVQALKLVCNECDESKAGGSESCGQEDASVADMETRTDSDSSQLPDSSSRARYSLPDYSTIPEARSGLSLSASDVFSSSRAGRQESGSFRRHSSSGPLRTGRSRQFWERVRGLSRGTVSEHGVPFRL